MFPQVQQIKMMKVACTLVEHQGKSIKTLCLNPLCKARSTLCTKCLINDHLGCRSQIIELEKVPQQLIELQQLQLTILTLQENINQRFKKLLSRIEQILLPLAKYQVSPNFTNLNEIGFLLKQLPKQKILDNIDEAKLEIQILLDHQNCNQAKEQEDQKSNEVYWYKEGRTLLLLNRQEEAKKCFEEAIRINPNYSILASVYQLSRCLGSIQIALSKQSMVSVYLSYPNNAIPNNNANIIIPLLQFSSNLFYTLCGTQSFQIWSFDH